MKYAFAIDFAGDNLIAGFVSESLELSGVSKLDLTNFMAGDSSPMDKLVSLLMAKMRTAPGDIEVIALSFDCDLSPDRRSVVRSLNAPWLDREPLAEILVKSLDKPVIIERRAEVFLLV